MWAFKVVGRLPSIYTRNCQLDVLHLYTMRSLWNRPKGLHKYAVPDDWVGWTRHSPSSRTCTRASQQLESPPTTVCTNWPPPTACLIDSTSAVLSNAVCFLISPFISGVYLVSMCGGCRSDDAAHAWKKMDGNDLHPLRHHASCVSTAPAQQMKYERSWGNSIMTVWRAAVWNKQHRIGMYAVLHNHQNTHIKCLAL